MILRYLLYAKAALCQACYNALRLTNSLERKGFELLQAIPKPLLSLHLRFEPDMVVYSQFQYSCISSTFLRAIEVVCGDRKPGTGEASRIMEKLQQVPSYSK